MAPELEQCRILREPGSHCWRDVYDRRRVYPAGKRAHNVCIRCDQRVVSLKTGASGPKRIHRDSLRGRCLSTGSLKSDRSTNVLAGLARKSGGTTIAGSIATYSSSKFKVPGLKLKEAELGLRQRINWFQ